MAEKPDKSAESSWLWQVFLLALTYPLLDAVGDWLLKRYVGFFLDVSQAIDFSVLWSTPGDRSSLLELRDKADLGEGGVFLLVCWAVLYWWPARSRRSRINLIRSWIRRPLHRCMMALALIIVFVVACSTIFEALAAMGLLLVHPFVARWCLGNAIEEVSGVVAFEAYRDRVYVRRLRVEKKRTLLDRMVS